MFWLTNYVVLMSNYGVYGVVQSFAQTHGKDFNSLEYNQLPFCLLLHAESYYITKHEENTSFYLRHGSHRCLQANPRDKECGI